MIVVQDEVYAGTAAPESGGGGEAVIKSLSVTPTTSAQTIRATGGTDGYSPVNVAAVTAAIDSNITAQNIVSGISILGVNGSATELNGETVNITPTTTAQTITPTSPANGITQANVAAVTASIDQNIVAGNIVSGVSILGVSGSAVELNGETVSITPSTSQQIITPTSPKNGITQATVAAVTSSIDANITAGNIKDGVTILGVTGSYTGGGGGVGIPREVVNGVYKAPVTSFTFSLPSGATNVDNKALYCAFQNSTGLTSADLSSLTTLSGEFALYYAFQNCTNLTSVNLSSLTNLSGDYALEVAFQGCTGLTGTLNLSSLTTISGNGALHATFQGCTGLTSVNLSSLTTVSNDGALKDAFQGCTHLAGALDLSSLTTVSGRDAFNEAFQDCSGLTSVDLSSLTTVSEHGLIANTFYCAFKNCSNLSNVDLSSLTTVSGRGTFAWCFEGCNLTSLNFSALTNLTDTRSPFEGICAHTSELTGLSISFPALTTNSFGGNTNALNRIMADEPPVTTIHFPSNLESTIQAQNGYPLFDGESGNVTLAFDLPATS